MKPVRRIQFFLIALLIVACSSSGGGVGEIFATDTPLPTARAGVTPAPDEEAAVMAFFDALKNDDYEVMYTMLAQSSRDVLTLAGTKMSVKSYDYELGRWNGSPHITVKYWMVLPEPPCV